MSDLSKREEDILAFWNKEKIFEKSLKKRAPMGEYVFYDGPPFANGLPHYGHILASTIKDTIPRYRTMRGFRVLRKWGWDCHGLPVENLVEKELGFKQKRDIEHYGISNFNEAARRSIMKDVEEWKRIIPRLGRWADMERDYKTMDTSYTESVWWAFKNLYDRGLAYEGFKAMHFCPRCGTTLSNFEVAQGYKDIQDIAVTVKLPLLDEPNTSLLVWTTTPWTLPGNTAAGVNAEATYVKVKVGEEYLIASAEYFNKNSSDRLGAESSVVGFQNFSQNIQPSQTFLGKELIGKKYTPPFDYFKDEIHKHKTHAWKVYHAPYVSVEDGTGIVHLAPAFGEEDLLLAQKEKIPLIHHVTEEGKFIATVKDFAGLLVKPKGNPRETDQKIAEFLRAKNMLFKEETVLHSYPHCWRCDTPLLNWAANSWFVNVQKIKNKLVSENKKIHWVPGHVGSGRFGKWLAGARDWAISRNRFWGAPLPVWRHSKTKELRVVGSVEELLKMVRRSGNRYSAMRHGEAQSNVNQVLDLVGDPENHLTEKGKKDAAYTATKLRRKNIDVIISSPFLRTQETAKIVQKELGLPDSAVMVDERLREFNDPDMISVRRRVGEFLFEVEMRYCNKNVLIISHGCPLWFLVHVSLSKNGSEFKREEMLRTAEVRELPFIPFPHNADYELDLHRPYIDEIAMGALGGEWKREAGVFDCWFESGAMPFASNHYPFVKNNFNPKRFFGFLPKGYPADFIAEGLDQTRGWFYSALVLGVGLFGRRPYKNVVVNGLILASNGEKMSKRLRNYPDPVEIVEKYGADALRYYLLSSPTVRGEDLRFSERGVDEIAKKILTRLDNVRSFYKLYAPPEVVSKRSSDLPEPAEVSGLVARPFSQQLPASLHVLDRWIFSRLGELVRDTTAGFEKYELDTAVRPLGGFVDDLSVWYLRRSRERFKEDGKDKKDALATLRFVLYTLAHVMAPTMPFYAEYLFRELRSQSDAESVHLSNWPAAVMVDPALHAEMRDARAIASQALQMREKAGIKVRQPLALLKMRRLMISKELLDVVMSETNVKKIIEDTSLEHDFWLDTEITPELREEGLVREWVRAIQEWRKEQNMTIADRPVYTLEVAPGERQIARNYRLEIIAAAGLRELDVVIKKPDA